MIRPLLLSLVLASPALAAGPKVTFVIGGKATPMDKLAAEQLSKDFHALFDAETSVQAALPKDATNVVLIGHPQSNAAISGDGWPKLTAQGHILKSTKQGLIVGGGSPLATLWAASELSHRFGIRHLLSGDVMPVEKPAFKLEGFDVTLEPKILVRGWSMFNGSATGGESWTKDEQLALLRQLVKLKFTNLLLPSHVIPPTSLPVDGDTAGRKAFGGANQFPAADGKFDLASDAKALGFQVAVVGLVTHSLGAPGPSVLPQFSQSILDRRFQAMLKYHHNSFMAGAMMPGDLDAAAHFASRVSFDAKLTAAQSLNDLITPICGDGVAERVQTGFDMISQAAKLIEANDPSVGIPNAQMLQRHLESKDSLPAWITEVKTLYTNAMSEMYRANTRAREGARSFTLYHAKRFEFAMHYFTALESLYKAHDKATRGESLEAALESIYNALNAYGDVAKNASDRGAIALMNLHAYRPAQKLADEAAK